MDETNPLFKHLMAHPLYGQQQAAPQSALGAMKIDPSMVMMLAKYLAKPGAVPSASDPLGGEGPAVLGGGDSGPFGLRLGSNA